MIDLEHEERMLWGQAARGMYGIIRILESYERNDLPRAPTNDFIRAAMQLRELAERIEIKKHADNTFSYEKAK